MTRRRHQFFRNSVMGLLMACGTLVACTLGADTEHERDSANGSARTSDEIHIVGSSTVYPFATKVAQEFSNKTGFNVVVETTGSGGGHKLFCSGIGPRTPDITNSSRPQKPSERALCERHHIRDSVEVKIGLDGIVLANARPAAPFDLNLGEIYRAFAKDLPTSAQDCAPRPNPNMNWSDIRADLPNAPIEAYGPPPTSGTRDAFVEIAMTGGALSFACLAELRQSDPASFARRAHTLREDGKWIDAGENDNAIVQTLTNTPTAIGVFGHSFLGQNTDIVQGATISGIAPSFENIARGDYKISRSLYFYLKPSHLGTVPGLREYALEFTSEAASGPGGYLEEIGLVPLPFAERAGYRHTVETMQQKER